MSLRSHLLRSSACVGLVCSSAVVAQSPVAASEQIAEPAKPAASGPIEDIVVTATKRSEQINDVPLAILAQSGEQLKTAGVDSTAELSRVVPGFTSAKTYFGTPTFSLRGVGFPEVTLGALPSVSTYVDEASLPFAVMTQGTTLDLERVEVLKGPQGLLFGQNATAGAINFVAAKPTRTFEAGIRASYGRFNTVQGEGFISGPLTSTLSARLAVSGTRSDDWQYSYTRHDSIGQQKKAAARAQLLWEPSDGIRFLLNVNGWIDKSDPQMPQLVQVRPNFPGLISPTLTNYPLPPKSSNRAADWDANPSPATYFPEGLDHFFNNHRFGQVTLRGDIDLSPDITLTSLTNYVSMRFRSHVDLDGTDRNNASYLVQGNLSGFGQELRLTGKLGDTLDFIVGANYEKDKALEVDPAWFDDISSVNVAGPDLAFHRIINRSFQNYETKAAFANIDFHLSEQLTLSGGLRYTDVKHKLRGACSADYGDGGFATFIKTLVSDPGRAALGLAPVDFPAGGCTTLDDNFAPVTTNDDFSENNLSWRANLAWRPNDDMLLYANVSRGFKSGSYINNSITAASQYKAPIKQEQLTAYELGYKVGLLNGRAQINTALFYYDYKDKQLLGIRLDPVFGRLFVLANIPKSRVQGFDMEVTLVPVDGLRLKGAVNYSDSKIKSSYLLPDITTQLNDVKGNPFNYAPKWNFTTDVEYEWAVNGNLQAFVGGNTLYNSATNANLARGLTADISALTRIKAYMTLDLRAGVRDADGRWELSAWGRNVTSTYYWNNVVLPGDTLSRFTGAPATYGVTANYRF